MADGIKRTPVHHLDPEGRGDGPIGLQVLDGRIELGDSTGGGGSDASREVIMASGVSFPAEPIESSDGGDWLYGEVTP